MPWDTIFRSKKSQPSSLGGGLLECPLARTGGFTTSQQGVDDLTPSDLMVSQKPWL